MKANSAERVRIPTTSIGLVEDAHLFFLNGLERERGVAPPSLHPPEFFSDE